MANEAEMKAYLKYILMNTPGLEADLERQSVVFELLMGDRPFTQTEITDFMQSARSFEARNKTRPTNSPSMAVLTQLEETTDGFRNEGELMQKGGSSGSMLEQVFGLVAVTSRTEEELKQIPQTVDLLLSFGLLQTYGLDYGNYQLDIGVATHGLSPQNAILRLVYRPQPKKIVSHI